jgi:hypothetical protein
VSRRGALSPRAKPLIQTGGCSSEYPTFKAPLGVGGISENQFPRKFSQRQFGSIPICTDRSKNNHTIGDKTRSTTGILAVKGLVDRARRSWYLIMCGNNDHLLGRGVTERELIDPDYFQIHRLLFEPIPGRVTPSTFDGQEGTVAPEAGDSDESQRYNGVAYAVSSE